MRLRVPLVALVVVCAAGPGQSGHVETAIFAGGRFWSLEEDLRTVPGVIAIDAGYITARPPEADAPDAAAADAPGYEAVRVTYDPAATSYRRLLLRFWLSIDPLDAGGQFCDRGAPFRTAILALGPEQAIVATTMRRRVAQTLGAEVATVVLQDAEFRLAEERHQDYVRKNPARYDFYRRACGRDAGLRAIWGTAPMLSFDP